MFLLLKSADTEPTIRTSERFLVLTQDKSNIHEIFNILGIRYWTFEMFLSYEKNKAVREAFIRRKELEII